MRYVDIKDIVIGTADTLNLVPGEVVYDLLGGDLPGITDQDYLIGIEVKGITCATHAYMPDVDGDSPYTLYHVCSILVHDVPSLFFIYEGDTGATTYVLDWGLAQIFIDLLKQWLRAEKLSSNSLVSCIAEDVGVPILTSYMGMSIEYGAGPERGISGND